LRAAALGGSPAALGSAQQGLASILLEKSPSLGEVGAGIQLGPKAFHRFDFLGVGAAAGAIVVYVDKLRLMDARTADEITDVDLGQDFRARFASPDAVVHRGDLHGGFFGGLSGAAMIRIGPR
jgi:3-hydroxybenzoate 6-monooxygenase